MIPVRIQPIFWVFAALIGWMSSGSLFGTLAWVGIIFFSVLFHEYGHALTAVLFKQRASIQLVALGGLTTFDGPKLKSWQRFLIVLNGPLFGFGLFVIATVLLQYQWTPVLMAIFRATQVANLFWTVVNLFPVLPLDGGQLLRIVLEAWFGVKGLKIALLVGAVLSSICTLGFLLLHQYLAAALFALFAFQGFSQWRQNRSLQPSDQDETIKQQFLQAEAAFTDKKVGEAEKLFREVRAKTKQGMLFLGATQYLALIQSKAGALDEAYELLVREEKDLTEEGRVLLHELAASLHHWDVVAKLSHEVYQLAPTQEKALANARAFAYLHQAKPAGGWLQTTLEFGEIDREKILAEPEFQALMQNPEFREFIEP